MNILFVFPNNINKIPLKSTPINLLIFQGCSHCCLLQHSHLIFCGSSHIFHNWISRTRTGRGGEKGCGSGRRLSIHCVSGGGHTSAHLTCLVCAVLCHAAHPRPGLAVCFDGNRNYCHFGQVSKSATIQNLGCTLCGHIWLHGRPRLHHQCEHICNIPNDNN